MNKFLYHLSIFTLLLTAGFICLIFYWLLYPYNPIEFKEISLGKTEYKAGDNLDIYIDYCKYTNLPAETTVQYIDGIIFTQPPFVSNTPKKCGKVVTADVVIPTALVPGDYNFRQTMTYQVNPIRQVSVVFETPKFEIK